MNGDVNKSNRIPPPEGVTEQEVDQAIHAIADEARMRMVMDQCGGLPGPPSMSLSLPRRILAFLERRFGLPEHGAG